MPLHRAIILLFCLIAVCSTAMALSVSAENSIAKGTQWSFSVSYALSSGNDLQVFVDSELVFGLFEHNGSIFVNDSQKSPKVLSSNNSSGTLFISFTGLSEGKHVVSTKVLSGNDVLDQSSKEIEFFSPLNSSERDLLNNKISTLEGTVSSQNNQISSLKTDLDEKNNTIDSLARSNQQLSDSLNNANDEISLLQESNRVNSNEISQLKTDLNSLLTESESQKKTILGSMFALGSNDFVFIGLVALIAIVIVLAFVAYKYDGGSIYSGKLFGRKGFDSKAGDEVVLEQDKNPLNSGKWAFAFGSFGRKPSNNDAIIPDHRKPFAEKKFGYTDLLKKE